MDELKHEPWVYFTRGIPSSGKSHLVGLITKLYKNTVISKDTIRKQLYPNWRYDDLSYRDLIIIGEGRDALFDVAIKYNKTVILDETFTDMTDILYMLGKVPMHYKKGLIDLTWVPLYKALEYNKLRPEPRDEEVIRNHARTLKLFPTAGIKDMFDQSLDGTFWLKRG